MIPLGTVLRAESARERARGTEERERDSWSKKQRKQKERKRQREGEIEERERDRMRGAQRRRGGADHVVKLCVYNLCRRGHVAMF